MTIIQQIRELKDHLLEKFQKEIGEKKRLDHFDIETAVRRQQGGLNFCGFNEAKSLINLLWDHHGDELYILFGLVETGRASTEVKRTYEEANKALQETPQ